MHHLYSSIISRNFIIILLNKFSYCIYIKSFNVFLSFSQIIVEEQKILEMLHISFY